MRGASCTRTLETSPILASTITVGRNFSSVFMQYSLFPALFQFEIARLDTGETTVDTIRAFIMLENKELQP